MDDLITIRLADDERRYTKKFPYPMSGDLRVSHDDPYLQRVVAECLQEFGGDPVQIQIDVKIHLNW